VVAGSTTIVQYPQDTTVRVNHTAFLLCEASFNPLLDLTYDWYQNGIKIIFYRIKTMGDTVYVKPDPHFKRVRGKLAKCHAIRKSFNGSKLCFYFEKTCSR